MIGFKQIEFFDHTGKGEVAACLRLYSTENISRTAALVFVIASRFASRLGGGEGTDLGMRRNRLLIQTRYGLLRIVWPFIRLQGVLHIGNVVFIEVGHGRGRDAGYPAPPAQIPTGGTTASNVFEHIS